MSRRRWNAPEDSIQVLEEYYGASYEKLYG